jgi:hypothetical protein
MAADAVQQRRFVRPLEFDGVDAAQFRVIICPKPAKILGLSREAERFFRRAQ